MTGHPSKTEQIRQFHARFIIAVVEACSKPEARSDLEPLLKQAEAAGWKDLAAVIRRISKGERETGMLGILDDEDQILVSCILEGIQNPATLPDPDEQPDGSMAAPGLASMIHAAARGDVNALQLLGNMGEQMSKVGGDMSRVSGIFKRLVDGERDADTLTKGMGKQAEGLTLSLLEELGKLEQH
ncbi:MAG TPA: hypothetical protein DDW55_02930 [Gammaproteobacteria bacterium]|nr:hypothetical protein [Gammaproteobacteria bacterium]